MSLGISGAAWAGIAAAGASAYGANQNKKAAKAGSGTTESIDPRMAQLLYGDGGANTGLANLLYQEIGTKDVPQGQQTFGNGLDNYLRDYGTQNFMSSQQAAQRLQGSDIGAPQIAYAPGMGDPATVGRAWVDAPSQNDIDLSPAFNDFINGPAGANQYLTGAIQKGINQSTNAFGNYLTDAQKGTQELLGNVRGGAIAAGQYGSSRQGLAEGKAIDSFNTNIGRAATQFGQNNTDAAVAAQAGAYDADRNRSLSALQGLSGQQFGVASQNAELWQRTNEANANFYQDTMRANQNATLATNQLNTGAQLQTNSLNSQNRATGTGLSSGLLSQAYGMGQSTSNAQLDRLGKVGGYLSPFSGLGGSTTSTQPYYGSTAGSALGGAAAGLSLWNQFNQGSGYNAQDIRNTTSL